MALQQNIDFLAKIFILRPPMGVHFGTGGGIPADSPQQQHEDLVKSLRNGTHKLYESYDILPYEYFGNEEKLKDLMDVIAADLSEPYGIYTYRQFLNRIPCVTFVAMTKLTGEIVGAIVCRSNNPPPLDEERPVNRSDKQVPPIAGNARKHGYIAMLAVKAEHRKQKIGMTLICRAVDELKKEGCDLVYLETEETNLAALRLYESLGFIRTCALNNYYLSGTNAFRLKLFFNNKGRNGEIMAETIACHYGLQRMAPLAEPMDVVEEEEKEGKEPEEAQEEEKEVIQEEEPSDLPNLEDEEAENEDESSDLPNLVED